MSLASFAEPFEPFSEWCLQVLQNSSRYSRPCALREYILRGGPFSEGTFSTSTSPRLLDPDEQRVDGALGDVGEALLAQPGGDLVAVCGLGEQDREDDALQRSLSISVACLST